MESAAVDKDDPSQQLKKAFGRDDAVRVRQLLEQHPELKAKINEPLGPFDSQPIINAKSRQMVDVLLAAGADLNAKSHWWAGGFGLLHGADPELAAYAVERGAIVDVHAAARLGMLDKLRELMADDAELVNARGGDGQTPLHFARSVPIAEYLLAHGAAIDARDVDHESTPAQYMLGDRPEVARYLVKRGCETDILLAAAVGDVNLVRQHLDADPGCIRIRARPDFFPMSNPKAGGHIYQWTLGFNASAYQAAAKFGNKEVFRLLMERSPADSKLVAACWLDDRATVDALLAEHPNLAASLSASDQQEIAHAARNNNTPAVRLMLHAGLPVAARGQHGGTPLHWAAWHGNPDMVQDVLRFAPSLENVDNDFHATPLGWAVHGSEFGWYCQTGHYAAVVDALLQAGAKVPDEITGTEPVREVLRRHANVA